MSHFRTFPFLFSIALGFLMSQNSYSQIIKPGDRVLFLGDSITKQGGKPKGYVTIFQQTLADAGLTDVEVLNAGIGGHKVPDLQKRLKRDVLDKKPTHVAIFIGINDVWHSLKPGNMGTPRDVFDAGLRDIVAQLDQAGIKSMLCTPSVIGEKTDGSNQLDPLLEQFSATTRSIASELNLPLLDLRKAFIDHLKTANPDNRDKGVLTRDTVHLNDAGNQFVADQMAAAFGLSDAANPSPSGLLRHVVLFQFKDDVTEAEVATIVDQFGQLREKVDSIVDYEAGTDVSTENLAQGFTHCFIVTFKDAAGRDEYLPHPAHKEFVKQLDGKIEKVLVIDFLAQ